MNSKIRIAYPITSTFIDYPDDESEAVLIYVMGCDRSCVGCHNPKFRDYNNKENTVSVTYDSLIKLIDIESKKRYTRKLVFSGGDPLSPGNIDFISEFLKFSWVMGYDSTIYTGYNIEWVVGNRIRCFKYVKCGEYKEEYKQIPGKTDEYLKFSSTNQELYDSEYRLLSKNGIYYFNGGE